MNLGVKHTLPGRIALGGLEETEAGVAIKRTAEVGTVSGLGPLVPFDFMVMVGQAPTSGTI